MKETPRPVGKLCADCVCNPPNKATQMFHGQPQCDVCVDGYYER